MPPKPNPYGRVPKVEDCFWPAGVKPKIVLSIDPQRVSSSLREFAVRRLIVNPRHLQADEFEATHVLLDSLLPVSEQELSAYEAKGQKVLSFDWAIDSFLAGRAQEEDGYRIVARGPVKDGQAAQGENGRADELDPPAPAAVPDEDPTADEQAPVKVEKNVEEDVEMENDVDGLGSRTSLEREPSQDPAVPSPSDTVDDQPPALLDDDESDLSELDDDEDQCEADDDDDEQPDNDDEGNASRPADQGEGKKKNTRAVAPLVAHDIALNSHPLIKTEADKAALHAVNVERSKGPVALDPWRSPRDPGGFFFDEDCHADAYSLPLDDGISDLPGGPKYVAVKRGKPWLPVQDRYLIRLYARIDPGLDQRRKDDETEIARLMVTKALPQRQMGGVTMRYRGNKRIRKPWFDAAIALDRSRLPQPIRPLPRPFRYAQLGVPLSLEENTKIARLFVQYAPKTDERVGVQTFMAVVFGVLGYKRRYDEIFKPWEAVWYAYYPEKTPQGRKPTNHGADPWGYQQKIAQARRANANSLKREASPVRSASPAASESASSSSRGSVGQGRSKRVKLENEANEE